MANRVRAVAEVEVTLRIESGSSWGDDCSLNQVHKQAVEGALGKLRKATQASRDFKLSGPIKVIRVQSIIEDETHDA